MFTSVYFFSSGPLVESSGCQHPAVHARSLATGPSVRVSVVEEAAAVSAVTALIVMSVCLCLCLCVLSQEVDAVLEGFSSSAQQQQQQADTATAGLTEEQLKKLVDTAHPELQGLLKDLRDALMEVKHKVAPLVSQAERRKLLTKKVRQPSARRARTTLCVREGVRWVGGGIAVNCIFVYYKFICKVSACL